MKKTIQAGGLALAVFTIAACTDPNVPMATANQDIGRDPVIPSQAQQIFADVCLNSGANFQAFSEKTVALGMLKFKTEDFEPDGHRQHDFRGSPKFDLSAMKHDNTMCSVVYGIARRQPDPSTTEASFDSVNPNNFDIYFSSAGDSGLNALFASK